MSRNVEDDSGSYFQVPSRYFGGDASLRSSLTPDHQALSASHRSLQHEVLLADLLSESQEGHVQLWSFNGRLLRQLPRPARGPSRAA